MEKLGCNKNVIITFNASGAVKAAHDGHFVIVVDVIDMSTSLEAALQGGAAFIFGASPDQTNAPVYVNPYLVGIEAGKKALEINSEIVIIAEPRWGNKALREAKCSLVRKGINEAGAKISEIIPNLGAEVINTMDFKDKVIVGVSDTGGVAFDAAWQVNKQVSVGTIARTLKAKGKEPIENSAKRAISLAQGKSIAVVAASSNSQEDILGSYLIAQAIIDLGYLK